MRGQLNDLIKGFAEERGFGFASDIIPTGLLNEKYPCIYLVAPNATYSNAGRWTYAATFYLVAPKGKKQNASAILDDLQQLSRDLFLFLQKMCDFYTDSTMIVRPKAELDNSGAVALEMTLNIYESDGCR